MNCPRCEVVVMTERERDGILVDICTSCRGVWLDRGELEKLIAKATKDFEEADREHDSGARRVRHEHDDDDDDDYDHDRGQRGQHGQRKKRSWFDSLGDIFG